MTIEEVGKRGNVQRFYVFQNGNDKLISWLCQVLELEGEQEVEVLKPRCPAEWSCFPYNSSTQHSQEIRTSSPLWNTWKRWTLPLSPTPLMTQPISALFRLHLKTLTTPTATTTAHDGIGPVRQRGLRSYAEPRLQLLYFFNAAVDLGLATWDGQPLPKAD